VTNSYRVLSDERKKLQEEGLMPSHWSTGSWQLFKNKYLYQASNPKEQYQRIAATLAAHTPDPSEWKEKFLNKVRYCVVNCFHFISPIHFLETVSISALHL